MFINADHPAGINYGDGYLQGDGSLGQVVKIAGNDLFAVNTDPAAKSYGLLMKDYKGGDMPGIYCGGGIYTTDVFIGTIAAGDALMSGVDGKLTKLTGVNLQIATAINVSGGVLKFKLLI
ncbi:MAG: hypothetical protein HZA78_11260 [Candidatus Schekmanbacteria bacterium]|nr:hypothetical protein [Candidatus Schekmanbacteria bacterium]